MLSQRDSIGLFALQMLLPRLFPSGDLFRFTRYAVIGLWGTCAKPRLA